MMCAKQVPAQRKPPHKVAKNLTIIINRRRAIRVSNGMLAGKPSAIPMPRGLGFSPSGLILSTEGEGVER